MENYTDTRYYYSSRSYGPTPQSYVLFGAYMINQSLHKDNLVKTVVERLSHLQKNGWVDEETTAVLLQYNLHRRDVNVFIHVSILYEKLGQQYVLKTFTKATDIQALFFWPNEAAI